MARTAFHKCRPALDHAGGGESTSRGVAADSGLLRLAAVCVCLGAPFSANSLAGGPHKRECGTGCGGFNKNPRCSGGSIAAPA